MQKMIRRIQNPEIPLKKRLFQLLSVIALAEFLIVTVYTILSGGDRIHVLVMLIGTVLFTVTVSYTVKSGRMRLGATVSGLLYYSIYPTTYFSSGGMYGGAPVVFSFALVYVFLVTEKLERIVSLAACITVSAICYALAYMHPELLDRHTAAAEHVESFLSICLVTLLLCTLFAFVTEVYREENRIVQKQKREIEELSLSQKRFFSNMSHEIRTPVNAIIGLNEMNLREPLSEEVQENSQNIEVAGKILLQTINEIMDMSKLETGGMEIVEGVYPTTGMLSDIVNMTWLRAQEKGLDFKVEVDPALPVKLYGDEVHIRQILLNVITNGIKYTKKGSIVVSLGYRSKENDSILMMYDVRDTGMGIREENIPCLFDAFRRVDAQQTHTIEGTGLGLSIVKQLLDMMGGTIRVDSVYGQGSVFHIEIPQKVVDETPVGETNLKEGGLKEGGLKEDSLKEGGLKEDSLKEDSLKEGGLKEGSLKEDSLRENNLKGCSLIEGDPKPGKAEQNDHKKKSQNGERNQEQIITQNRAQNRTQNRTQNREQNEAQNKIQDDPIIFQGASLRILAVDDTRMNLMVVKKLLRDTGAVVDTSESGVEALEMTMKNRYDVILMDHQMPEMDGIECLHRIRTQEGGLCGDSKVICLTANVGAEMEKMYQQEGFDGYLEKPVRERILKREIARLRNRR